MRVHQTTWDKEGYAIGNSKSTTFTGAIETAEEFGKSVEEPGTVAGAAGKEGPIGDGAEWIWNLADVHFPGAVQIVDVYHARQHLWDLLRHNTPMIP